MKTWITAVIVLAAVFLGGWLLGRRASRPEVVETVRIDTVFYERTQPVSVSDNVVTVDVPRLLFVAREPPAAGITNQDTIQVTNQATNQGHDSVQMQIIMRTLEYRDSTYYARVVGPVVGYLTPRLDYIETYDKTVERVQLVREPYAWELGPALGTWITSDDSGVWAGGYARRTFGQFSVSASAGYDPRKKTAFGQIEARMSLLRR